MDVPHLTSDRDGPLELDDLDRVVLWAIRSVAVGRGDCASLRRTFFDLYGSAADQILCGLLVMVRLLAGRSPAGLRLHLPGSSAVSRDELSILAALAAMQDDGPADVPVAGADPTLVSAFRYVAELLARRGRRLSRLETETPRPRTLH